MNHLSPSTPISEKCVVLAAPVSEVDTTPAPLVNAWGRCTTGGNPVQQANLVRISELSIYLWMSNNLSICLHISMCIIYT